MFLLILQKNCPPPDYTDQVSKGHRLQKDRRVDMPTVTYGSPHDANAGGGYGRISNRLHKPRKMGKMYPYIEIDDLDDFEDEDTERAVISKLDFPRRTDTYAAAGTDPFYFAAGNTKLSDCFERPDKVLREIHALGDSMSPVSQKQKKISFGRGAGSSFPGGTGNYRRTGSKRGYFSSPPRLKFEPEEDFMHDDEDVPIKNIKDLAAKQGIRFGTFSKS